MRRKGGDFTAKKQELTKEERIKRAERKIKRALCSLDKNKLAIVEPLIQTAAYCSVCLEELQEIIDREGYTSEYQNGENQHGTKQSDEVKTLIALQKNQTAAVKTLADIAPTAPAQKSKLAELMRE